MAGAGGRRRPGARGRLVGGRAVRRRPARAEARRRAGPGLAGIAMGVGRGDGRRPGRARSYLPPGTRGAAYALLRVWSPGTAPVRLRIGASGRFRAWIDGRPILEAIPADGASGTEEATVTLPAGWSSLVFRVEAGGERPALRAWTEHEADRARDRFDLLLVRGAGRKRGRRSTNRRGAVRGRRPGTSIGPSVPPDPGRSGYGAEGRSRRQTRPNAWRRSGRTG